MHSNLTLFIGEIPGFIKQVHSEELTASGIAGFWMGYSRVVIEAKAEPFAGYCLLS